MRVSSSPSDGRHVHTDEELVRGDVRSPSLLRIVIVAPRATEAAAGGSSGR